MPRLRVGVVLLIPPSIDREVDALRRALDDGTLGRVPAHLTLVPPVNVREDRLGDALSVLRGAAASTRPFTVSLGAPRSFLPDSPTLYLPVVSGEEAVVGLRERVFREPLSRSLTWPYVPHVTVADEIDPERIAAAEAALGGFHADVRFDRVHLLREEAGRVWVPFSEAALAAPAIVGRGGLPLELSVTGTLDIEGRALLDAEDADQPPPPPPSTTAVAITARREGGVVGVLGGWHAGGMARVETLTVSRLARRQGVGSHLLAAFESHTAQAGCHRLSAQVPAGSAGETFLRHRGWTRESDLVLLQRDL